MMLARALFSSDGSSGLFAQDGVLTRHVADADRWLELGGFLTEN